MKWAEFEQSIDRMSDAEIEEMIKNLPESEVDSLCLDFVEDSKKYYKKIDKLIDEVNKSIKK
jgi:hypothetical protein